MTNRILHFLLLCLFAVGPLSLPARGVARPDSRVPRIFADTGKSGPGIIGRSPESQPAQPVYGYDWAPAVHKYHYGHADPVMTTDPSGHISLGGNQHRRSHANDALRDECSRCNHQREANRPMLCLGV